MPKISIKKTILYIFLVLLAAFAGLFLQILISLPDISAVNEYTPSETTIIYSSDGKEIARLHREENRRLIPLQKISKSLLICVLTMEDENFYDHKGISFSDMFRAIYINALARSYSQGGSTITQQLVRNLFLTRAKRISRKIAEVILALQMEKQYTKDEILELYLNNIYWGHNAYGVDSAAQLYFGKSATDLDLAESAMLASLIRGPEIFSPYKNPEVARKRQHMVIDKLLENNIITPEQALNAKAKQFDFSRQRLKRFGFIAPYFTSDVLTVLIEKYGKDMVYNGGLRVYTTLDIKMQEAAELVINKFVSEESRPYNFNQVALVAIDPRTGYVKALVGGADFSESMFNRVTQAKRQPGSSFKPFVYTAAMEDKLSPGMIIEDKMITFEVPSTEWNPTGKWEPNNFDGRFHGNVTLREALEKSLNIPSIKIADQVGIAHIIEVAKRMGINSPLNRNLALTLGVSDVTLLEMTSAYGVFANNGIKNEPVMIIKVTDREGRILQKHNIRQKNVLDPDTAAIMVDLMQGVLIRGTGIRGKIDRPAAAKTGTTQDFKDAWFIGYVPQLVAGVWVGNDDNSPMEGVVEVAVCPRIWKFFMERSLENETKINFPYPRGLEKIAFCIDSGQLVAKKFCPSNSIKEDLFWRGKGPTIECTTHTPLPPPEWLGYDPYEYYNNGDFVEQGEDHGGY